MAVDHLDAVTRLRRTKSGEDRYGNPIYSESSTSLPPAMFAPGHDDHRKDPVPGRSAIALTPTLYWHNQWPDVVESDRLTVRGITYEVDGKPADWRGSAVGGLTVTLREVIEEVP